MPPSHPLVRELTETVGDSLRCVATYGERDYDLLYIRPDVEASYTSDEMEEVYDDLILQRVGNDFLEHLFNAGSLQCSALGFEEATIFNVVGDGYGGLFVSVDTDADVEMPAFVERLKRGIQVRA